MKALCWNGKKNLSLEEVDDPVVLNPHDAIVKVKLSSACGSDLHLLNGFILGMRKGDIIGHEFMGEVVDAGPDIKKIKKGDRVVVGSIIGCGECNYCSHNAWSLCDNTNTHPWMLEKMYGYSGAGIFGYSHLFGGYAGSHAEYIRVPFADRGAFKVPEPVSDEQALFCSDAFPTGYMAADICEIQGGDIVAIWGCGGVGQMAIRSAWLMGAGRVIAIDRIPDRLEMARVFGKAEVINFEKQDVLELLRDMTGGRGPDRCIDAVGMEADTTGLEHYYDRAKQAMRLQTDRPAVLREAIMACRKGGTVSIIGVYSGLIDKFPIGAVMNKALTLKTGQMHAQKYIPRLMDHVLRGDVNPDYLITHRFPLEAGQRGYELFGKRSDNCVRVVFAP